MLYKPVFFGYIAAAIAVVAALVLIVIMLRQDRQYERKKLLALTGLLIGSICMSTLYFLSYSDKATGITVMYTPLERVLDLLCGFVNNLFFLLFLYFMATDGTEDPEASSEGAGRPCAARRLFLPALLLLIAGFLFAGIVYVCFVTNEYRVMSGHLPLAETAQLILTTVICVVTAVYAWFATHAPVCQTLTGTEKNARRRLHQLVATAAIVSILMALYNAAGSVAMFHNRFEYIDWSGVKDFNTWFFVLNGYLTLFIVIWFFGRHLQLHSLSGVGQPLDQAAPEHELEIPEALGLTPREEEITRLILQRHTYREIAEQLVISEYTVKRHVHNIYEKAGVSRRDELIRKLKDEG